MIEHGYQSTTYENYFQVKSHVDGEFVILLLYVDDMLNIGKDNDNVNKLKNKMKKYFSLKDSGPI